MLPSSEVETEGVALFAESVKWVESEWEGSDIDVIGGITTVGLSISGVLDARDDRRVRRVSVGMGMAPLEKGVATGFPEVGVAVGGVETEVSVVVDEVFPVTRGVSDFSSPLDF